MRARNGLISLIALLAGCGSEGTYPAQCGPPLAGWLKPSDGYSALAIVNRISVKRDGKIRWNGKEITADQLSKYSSIVPEMNPTPFTILEVDSGAKCAAVQRVRQTINARAKCTEGGERRCGEGGGPWARIGDVIFPNGGTPKYYPDGRTKIIQPTRKSRAELNAIQSEADAVAEKIEKTRDK